MNLTPIRKSRLSTIGALAVVACLCFPLIAQNDSPPNRQSELQLATKLMQATITDDDKQAVGTIRNMAVDLENGRIVYVILSRPNTDKLTPIPLSALRFNSSAQTARININSARLDDAPDFDPTGWDTINDPRWGRIVYQHFGMESEFDRVVGKKNVKFVPAKQVIGASCVDRQGEQVGKCDDLLVQPQNGALPFVVVQLEQDKADDRLIAAPTQIVDFPINNKTLTIDAERKQLTSAPAFKRDSINGDAPWAERVFAHFDVSPDLAYGYVPPTEPNRENEKFAADSWQTNSRYGQLFDEDKITTIDGRVTGVERVTPIEGMHQGVQLNVRGDDDRTHHVHLGPVWFIDRQQAQFKDGDQVQVVGADVKLDGERFIMASYVRHNNRVMLLRDSKGSPAWDAWHELKDLRNNPDYPPLRD